MDRRTALGMMGSAPLAGIISGVSTAQQTGAPPDPPRELAPAGADMGSLFSDIERLVSRNQYPYSFLTNRFRSVEEYRKTGREVVLDALGYQPPQAPAAPQVIDRQDLGEFVREKVLFSTSGETAVSLPA